MTKTSKVKLIVSVCFFTLGVFLFASSVQKYQIKLQSNAESRGLGVNFNFGGAGGTFSWTAIVEFNNQGLGPEVDTQYVVYHCSNTNGNGEGAGGYCGPGDGNLITTLVSENRSINATPGTTISLSHPGVTCGRVQIDFIDPQTGGYFGGDTYDTGQSCEQATPTPEPTNPPENTPVPTEPDEEEPTNTPVPTSPVDTPIPTATEEPTNTPIPTVTNTPVPTDTPVPTATPTATYTPTPTNTITPLPTATFTPIPTDTPFPTETPTPTLTFTPAPTNTPEPTFTPQPTYTPYPTAIQNLTVNNQPPGITPWIMILVPIGLVLIGLLL